jgi:transcription elongation factor Elf1
VGELPLYELVCPYCGEKSGYTFTIRSGAGVLKCPRCGRSFQVEIRDDAVVKVRA